MHLHEDSFITGWQRLIECLKLQVSFCKTATKYRALMRKMTNEDKAPYAPSPPCTCIPPRCWAAHEFWFFFPPRTIVLSKYIRACILKKDNKNHPLVFPEYIRRCIVKHPTIRAWHDSFIYVAGRTHMQDMGNDSFICVTWLNYTSTVGRVQDGEDPYDALNWLLYSAKEPLIIRLLCGKWPNYRAFVKTMTDDDKASYGSLPFCSQSIHTC